MILSKVFTQESSELFMAPLAVDSVFTNVPFYETIEICVNGLFKSRQMVWGLIKQQILETLSLTIKENVLLFDQNYYSQVDGAAMRTPLHPSLANMFLCHHKLHDWKTVWNLSN